MKCWYDIDIMSRCIAPQFYSSSKNFHNQTSVFICAEKNGEP